jgi:hypothetical protein
MRKLGRPKKEDEVDLLAQLQKIHKKFGGITPAKVVSEARRKRHPLHKYFDWEDTEAARKWRLHQANGMISRVQIIVSPQDSRTVNAFVSVTDDNTRKFVAMAEAMNDNKLVLQIFKQLEARIDTLENQLIALNLLKGVSKTAITKAKAPITKRREQLERKIARATK